MSGKRNVTVALDEDTVREAKVLAARRGTSVSRMLSVTIRDLVGREKAYEAARRDALALIEEGLHLGGKISATREELHER